jgi:hypothetical protein
MIPTGIETCSWKSMSIIRAVFWGFIERNHLERNKVKEHLTAPTGVMSTEVSIVQPVASRTELHLVLGRHRGWMAPWLNGTAAEWHCSSIRHVWVWKVCFMKRDVLSLGEWLPTVLPSCSGSSRPYGHPFNTAWPRHNLSKRLFPHVFT